MPVTTKTERTIERTCYRLQEYLLNEHNVVVSIDELLEVAHKPCSDPDLERDLRDP